MKYTEETLNKKISELRNKNTKLINSTINSYICPNCNEALQLSIDIEQNFCYKCGEKIQFDTLKIKEELQKEYLKFKDDFWNKDLWESFDLYDLTEEEKDDLIDIIDSFGIEDEIMTYNSDLEMEYQLEYILDSFNIMKIITNELYPILKKKYKGN